MCRGDSSIWLIQVELLVSCSTFDSVESHSNSFIKLNESNPNIILRLVSYKSRARTPSNSDCQLINRFVNRLMSKLVNQACEQVSEPNSLIGSRTWRRLLYFNFVD